VTKDAEAGWVPPDYLAWLPAFLFETDRVPERYIGKAWLAVLLGSVALAVLVNLVAPGAEHPPIHIRGPLSVLSIVIIGPFLETLLLMLPVFGLNRLLGPGPAVLASALLWGIGHSLSAVTWGLIAWWPFLIMSIAFLTWRRGGLVKAFGVVFSIHALQNGLAVFILLWVE
jgi:membrane protease YdiL (CAAX protease family)